MTLLVVLGFVVIATILAALYLSLRSARGGERASAMSAGGGSARGREARGGSRSERSPSLAGRLRGMAGRDKSAAAPGRRAGHDIGDRQGSRDYGPSRMREGADRADRNGLVAAGAGRGPRDPRSTGPQSPGPRPSGPRSPRFTPADPGAAGPGPGNGPVNGPVNGAANGTGPRRGAAPEFPADDTDPAFRPGYGRGPAGYDGYDAAADTRVSGPMDPMPGADRYGTGPAPHRGYAGEASGGYRTPGDPDAAPPRRGYGNGAGTGSNGYHTGPNPGRPDSPGGRYPEPPRRGRNADSARDATTGRRGYDAADRRSGPAEPGFDPVADGADATERFSARPGGFGPADRDRGTAERGMGTADHGVGTDGPFSPAPDPRSAADDRGDGGEDSRASRRRAGRVGKSSGPTFACIAAGRTTTTTPGPPPTRATGSRTSSSGPTCPRTSRWRRPHARPAALISPAARPTRPPRDCPSRFRPMIPHRRAGGAGGAAKRSSRAPSRGRTSSPTADPGPGRGAAGGVSRCPPSGAPRKIP